MDSSPSCYSSEINYIETMDLCQCEAAGASGQPGRMVQPREHEIVRYGSNDA